MTALLVNAACGASPTAPTVPSSPVVTAVIEPNPITAIPYESDPNWSWGLVFGTTVQESAGVSATITQLDYEVRGAAGAYAVRTPHLSYSYDVSGRAMRFSWGVWVESVGRATDPFVYRPLTADRSGTLVVTVHYTDAKGNSGSTSAAAVIN